MAIVRVQVPYEYLTRFNADGTVRGQHIKYLDKVYDDATGEVFSERELDALPVGDENSAVLLDAALGQVNAALAKAEEIERTAKDAAETARTAAETKRQEAETAAQQISAVLAEKNSELAALKAERGRP